MKNTHLIPSLLLCLCFCFSCENGDTAKQAPVTPLEKNEFQSLNGAWVLSNYLDTIKKYNTTIVCDFNTPLHILKFHALFLNIEDGEVFYYDIMGRDTNGIQIMVDSTFHIIHDFYKLKIIDDSTIFALPTKQLKTRNLDKKNRNYIYRKCTKEETELFMPKGHESDLDSLHNEIGFWLNKNLLSGKYQNTKDGSIIEFKDDGSLVGFLDYEQYYIGQYRADMHLHYKKKGGKNLDYVILSQKSPSKWDSYYWKIEGEYLYLQKNKDISNENQEPIWIPKGQIFKFKKI